jgi:predicted hydrocarbon binding protein
MYGLVNAAFRELIVSYYGAVKWDEIRAHAGVRDDQFSKMGAYPDEVTYRMVSSAAQTLGISGEQVLIAFGQHWVTYTDQEGYAALFEIAGDSLPDFLLSLDDLHVRVGQNFPRLKPPSFRFDVIDRTTMRMHYLTSREGLCPFVQGLLLGLSARFRTPLEVEQVECRAHGADHCVFMLRFGTKADTGSDTSAEARQP